jgi:hypothetical protein
MDEIRASSSRRSFDNPRLDFAALSLGIPGQLLQDAGYFRAAVTRRPPQGSATAKQGKAGELDRSDDTIVPATIGATIEDEPVQDHHLLVSVLVCGSAFDLENREKSALGSSFDSVSGHHFN